MILMLAPAPNLNLGGMPSGASYVSDEYNLVYIVNDCTIDQAALQTIGCYTLEPYGGWGTFGFLTLANLYAADMGALIPGRTGFLQFTVCTVFQDGANAGYWIKTGTRNGAGNWTQTPAPLSGSGSGGGSDVDPVVVLPFTTPLMQGAVGNGISNPASTRYSTLAALQAVYAFATDLSNELDWLGWQAALNLGGHVTSPPLHYVMCNNALQSQQALTVVAGQSWPEAHGCLLDFSAMTYQSNAAHFIANYNFASSANWQNATQYPANQITNTVFGGGSATYTDPATYHGPTGNFTQWGQQFTLAPGKYTATCTFTATLGASKMAGNPNPGYASIQMFGTAPGAGAAFSNRFAKAVNLGEIAAGAVTQTMSFDFVVTVNSTAWLTFTCGGYMNAQVTNFDIQAYFANCGVLMTRDGAVLHYPIRQPLTGCQIAGPGKVAGLAGVRFTSLAHADGNQSDLKECSIFGWGAGVSFEDGAYLIQLWACEIYGNGIGLAFANKATDAGENIRSYGSGIFNNNVGIDNTGGAEFTFYGTAVDYNRQQVANNYSRIEFHGSHCECQIAITAGVALFSCYGTGTIEMFGGMLLLASTSASFSGYIAAGTLTITSLIRGNILIGDSLGAFGFTVPMATTIASGAGNSYTLSNNFNLGSATSPVKFTTTGTVNVAAEPPIHVDSGLSAFRINGTQLYNLSSYAGVMASGAGTVSAPGGWLNSGAPNVNYPSLALAMDAFGGAGSFEPVVGGPFTNATDVSAINLPGGLYNALGEANTNRWSCTNVQMTLGTAQSHSGATALKLAKFNAASTGLYRLIIPVPVRAGQAAWFSMWWLSPNNITGKISVAAGSGNAGNGSVNAGASTAAPAVAGYVYTVTFTSGSAFNVMLFGAVIGTGSTGTQFSASGLTFTINAGSVGFATNDSFTLTANPITIYARAFWGAQVAIDAANRPVFQQNAVFIGETDINIPIVGSAAWNNWTINSDYINDSLFANSGISQNAPSWATHMCIVLDLTNLPVMGGLWFDDITAAVL